MDPGKASGKHFSTHPDRAGRNGYVTRFFHLFLATLATWVLWYFGTLYTIPWTRVSIGTRDTWNPRCCGPSRPIVSIFSQYRLTVWISRARFDALFFHQSFQVLYIRTVHGHTWIDNGTWYLYHVVPNWPDLGGQGQELRLDLGIQTFRREKSYWHRTSSAEREGRAISALEERFPFPEASVLFLPS